MYYQELCRRQWPRLQITCQEESQKSVTEGDICHKNMSQNFSEKCPPAKKDIFKNLSEICHRRWQKLQEIVDKVS